MALNKLTLFTIAFLLFANNISFIKGFRGDVYVAFDFKWLFIHGITFVMTISIQLIGRIQMIIDSPEVYDKHPSVQRLYRSMEGFIVLNCCMVTFLVYYQFMLLPCIMFMAMTVSGGIIDIMIMQQLYGENKTFYESEWSNLVATCLISISSSNIFSHMQQTEEQQQQ